MTFSDGIVLFILLSGLLFSIGRTKLTVPAALTGALLGWIIYAGCGFTGLAMMTVFFILGTAATSFHATHQPARTTGQVLANAGVAAMSSLLILLLGGHEPHLLVIVAACFASAAAGMIAAVFAIGHGYNARIFLIITLAGIFGNWVDSVLGAVFERKGRLSNNMVNFLNTLAAALFAGLIDALTTTAFG
jgi:uncharacterized membrane protein